jgi:hypothetical protein
MAIGTGGQISLADIGWHVGRGWGSTVGMYEARNSYYQGINDASGPRPFANGQSGYEFDDWYGYGNEYSYCYAYQYLRESSTDTDIRVRHWNYYGAYVQETWNWSTNNYDQYCFSMRARDYLDVYFDEYISWGSYWNYAEKYVYSNQRGYLFYRYEPVGYYAFMDRVQVGSGEYFYCRFIN